MQQRNFLPNVNKLLLSSALKTCIHICMANLEKAKEKIYMKNSGMMYK